MQNADMQSHIQQCVPWRKCATLQSRILQEGAYRISGVPAANPPSQAYINIKNP